ncbi:MAG: dTMP kinase, partial [Clostridia bacterium]|nr:dTMP kinase [Clostridia bacterium]
LFLDITPTEAFLRKGGADAKDRIEAAGLEFHEKVYEGYIKLCEKFPERIERIDCSGTKDQTHSNVINALKRRGVIR